MIRPFIYFLILTLAFPVFANAQDIDSIISSRKTVEDRGLFPTTPFDRPYAPKKKKLVIERDKSLDIDAEDINLAEGFVLKGVDLDGVTVYDEKIFNKIIQPYLNKPFDGKAAAKLLDEIEKKYQDDGYILARALPEKNQTFDLGNFEIQVIEGNLKDITLIGNVKEMRIVQKYLKKMKKIRPFNLRKFERYAKLMEDVPGSLKPLYKLTPLKVEDALYKDETNILIITYPDPDKGEIGLKFNNHYSELTGDYRFTPYVKLFSPCKVGDTLAMYLSTSPDGDKVRSIAGYYKTPLNSEGSTLTLNSSYSITKTSPKPIPTNLPGIFNILGDTRNEGTTFDFMFEHPFIKNRKQTLTGNIGMEISNNKRKFLSEKSNTNLRSVLLGGTYLVKDEYNGTNYFDYDFHHAVPILGATPQFDDYNLHEFLFFRYQKVTDNIWLVGKGITQYSSYDLPGDETLSVGGVFLGRGYDNNSLSGDKGYAVGLDLQYSTWDFDNPIYNELKFYTFVDYARLYHNDKADKIGKGYIASTGIGMRINTVNDLSLDTIIGMPLIKHQSQKPGDVVIAIGLGYKLNW